MAIKITIWRPDTCACEISYSWDDQLDIADRIHTPVQVVACDIHAPLADDKIAAHDAVLLENQSKNMAVSIIMDNFPDLTKDVLDDDGNVTGKAFKIGKQPDIYYDDKRALIIYSDQLDDNQKAQAQSLIDSQVAAAVAAIKQNTKQNLK